MEKMQNQHNRHHTYADYAQWPDDVRYELINGVPYMMSPAPSPVHQALLGALFGQLRDFLKGKPCKVFMVPFDVRLMAGGDHDDTVVQPDITVICDPSKLDDKGCNGAPDLAMEVLSPSTVNHDRVLKFNKYLQAGVREYWIVDPSSKTVSVNILDNQRYYATAYNETSIVPVHVLDGCRINLHEAFSE